jgi:hypothetical protein
LPEAVTTIDCVVWLPGVQKLPEVVLLVNVTDPPAQNVVGPEAVIVGVEGNGLTVTVTGAEGAEVQPVIV